MNVRIGRAAAAELAALAALEAACFPDPWTPASFTAELENEHSVFLCAREADELLGFIVVRLSGDEGEVLNLAVRPDARRAGVGRLLLRSAVGHCDRAGVRTLYLEVRASNAAAMALYAGAGFVAVGRRRSYYERPAEDALIMSRQSPGDGKSANNQKF